MALQLSRRNWLALVCGTLASPLVAGSFSAPARADDLAPIHVLLWFDTEDYLLPQSDDAALRLANWLTDEQVRATFKVVGEKARVLERRGRTDVIEALKRHDIGYHSNWHSVQPTPAVYLENLDWDEGLREFDRRERPGFDDVTRIFGQRPSCYGQPGVSWGPQSYGALRQWGVGVYLDAGKHVSLNGKPCYYCGLLNLYHLTHTLRAELTGEDDLVAAQKRFLDARAQMQAEGGGIVSIYYHPCEFVHREFWDGVNFSRGANPPPDQWKLPPRKTEAETQTAFDVFTRYVRFLKRFPEVRFITATEAAVLYRDRARERQFSTDDLQRIASGVKREVTFQTLDDCALSAAEIFVLLNTWIDGRLAGRNEQPAELTGQWLGPASDECAVAKPVTAEGNQFTRTVHDVQSYLEYHQRIPASVWLGSNCVSPETYLAALAGLAPQLMQGKSLPAEITIPPARLAVGDFVARDAADLWDWVIFPRGFHGPKLMSLARRQAWTLKPAFPARSNSKSASSN